jgi:hypothetical protein
MPSLEYSQQANGPRMPCVPSRFGAVFSSCYILFGLLVLLGIVIPSSGFSTTTLDYTDDFALVPGQKAGAPLSDRGKAGEFPQWRVDGSVVFTGAGVAGSERGGAAWFPLEKGVQTLRLNAVLNPHGADWVALAVGGHWGNSFYDTAQLWVLMRPSADYQIRANGGKLVLKTGKVPDFNRQGGNAVELAYDSKSGELTVMLNGQAVLDHHTLTGDQFVPVLDSAGFKFNGPFIADAHPSVGAFSLQVAGEFVPTLTLSFDEDLGVYAPRITPRPRLVGRGLGDNPAGLHLQLLDFDGKTVWTGEKQLVLLRGGFVSEPHLPVLTEQGYFLLRAEATDVAGHVLARVERSFAVIPEPPSVARTDANVFGAMVFPHIAYSACEKEIDARYMQRLGLRYVRSHRLNWLHIQPAAGAPFNWADADREVGIYRQYGLRIIATTGWPVPAWASSARGVNLPDSKGNFAPAPDAIPDARRFYRELATRFGDQIAFYEIGNEVDAHFWLGSAEHYLEQDIPGILQDYRDYFSSIAEAIRSVKPDALVAPGVTGALEGHTYRPWLTTQMEIGLGKCMTAYGPHYRADIGYANEVMARYGVHVPVIFTEIGGFSRNPGGADPFGTEIRRMISEDAEEMVTQLTHDNVRALCKFILREQPTYGGEGVIHAGLLGADFSLRPSYVAYATLVRSLASARYVEQLNLVHSADTGWGQGFAFEREGQRVNVIFLHGTAPTTVRLYSTEPELLVMDVMGNGTRLPVIGGVAKFSMAPDLPRFVIGRVTGEPGEIAIPRDTLLTENVLKLRNPGFEEEPTGAGINGWGIMTDDQGQRDAASANRFVVSLDHTMHRNGAQSVHMEATSPTKWDGVTQSLPSAQIPRPGPGEYLVFKVSVFARGEAIHGKGLGYTLSFRRPGGERLVFLGSSYFGFGGTYDWKELAGENRLDVWPDGADRVTLDLLLGLSTGHLWIDDVSVTVQLWKKAG